MTRAKDISKILTDADLSGTLDVTGAFTSQGIDDNADATAITIDSSENVGIGTSSPHSIINAQGSGTAGAVLTLENSNTALSSGNTLGSIEFYSNDASTNANGVRAKINADASSASGATDIIFSNTVSADTTLVERMRIDSSGRVMIGTTTEGAANEAEELTIAGTGGVGMTIRSTDSGTSRIYFSDGTSGTPEYAGYQIYNHSSNAMIFGTNATERMRIDSSGRVAIGATSANGLLTLATANSNTPRINLQHPTNDADATIDTYYDGSGTYLTIGTNVYQASNAALTKFDSAKGAGLTYYDSSGLIVFFNGAGGSSIAERMRIDNSGSVAIGTSSTASADRLTLKGSTSDNTTNFLIRNSSDTTLFQIDNNGLLKSVPTNNNITGSSANMVVFSDGQFARSTSSLRYKNTVNDATHGLTELLTLRPVTYKGNNDGDTIFGGLIAEEVHGAGLTEFVTYNDDDEPDALAYGNMVSLCIKAIQELKTELDSAKARITALENGE